MSRPPSENMKSFWRRVINKESVVYDIGAFIGGYAIPLAEISKKVLAFEGSLTNVKTLERNTVNYENIVIYPLAVHERAYETTTAFNDCRSHEIQHIKYIVLQDYMEKEKLPDPDFIKMDIEGMETIAMKGCTKILENIRPIWQMEYHPLLEGYKSTLTSTIFHHTHKDYPGFVSPENGGFDFKILKDFNYKVIHMDDAGVIHDEYDYPCTTGQWILCPEEKSF